MQWRIQDFRDGGRQPQGGRQPNFAENYKKTKKFGLLGVRGGGPLRHQIR